MVYTTAGLTLDPDWFIPQHFFRNNVHGCALFKKDVDLCFEGEKFPPGTDQTDPPDQVGLLPGSLVHTHTHARTKTNPYALTHNEEPLTTASL